MAFVNIFLSFQILFDNLHSTQQLGLYTRTWKLVPKVAIIYEDELGDVIQSP